MVELPSSERAVLGLAKQTPARVALGRTGTSLPTAALLAFGLDHALARDAVHALFDAATLSDDIAWLGASVLQVRSQTQGRADYLRRPDLGRRLADASRDLLQMEAALPCDIVVVLGDGLSPGAVAGQAPALVAALMADLSDFHFGPVVIATGARVALGDDIGAILRARLIVMLIGERPGLSTPESLGAYVTFAPRAGLSDADRNCVSNIHAIGLSPDAAAHRIAWLVRAALSRGVTGISLKDDSAFAALPRPSL